MEKLPEQWDTMTHVEKERFFVRYYLKSVREGEYSGIHEWAPQEIKDAYEAWKKEE
ncbi:MAG: hypothetical protein ACI32N_04530 [Bulleidia sp.]